MAKKSFNQRFPSFKWVLLFAVIITLPLTVFSVKNVSTNTSQFAAGSTCGGNGGGCYKYSCPRGYDHIGGTCGMMADATCCRVKIAPPTTLTNVSISCKKASIINSVDFMVKWNSVANANKYYAYWYTTKPDGSVAGYDHKLVTGTSTSFSIAIPTDSKLHWKVRGYNSTYNYYGTYGVVKDVPLSCR